MNNSTTNPKPKVVVVIGSLSSSSINAHLAGHIVEVLNRSVDATVVSRSAVDLPLYSDDLERSVGIPERVKKAFDQIVKSDGLLIVSPEYNGSFTAAIKNLIDWLSRVDERDKYVFKGRHVMVCSASPGTYGGIRGAKALLEVLRYLGADTFEENLNVNYPERSSTTDTWQLEADTLSRIDYSINAFCAKLSSLSAKHEVL